MRSEAYLPFNACAILEAPDRNELLHWLRHRPLAHYDEALDTLLVHAGTHQKWNVQKTLSRASEVESCLQGENFETLLGKMYGNSPVAWSGNLERYKRLRFIINCKTVTGIFSKNINCSFIACN